MPPDSSTEPEVTAENAATSEVDVKNEASSTSEETGVETTPSYLETVTAALEPKEGSEESPPSEDGTGEPAPEPKDESEDNAEAEAAPETDAELSEDELKNLSEKAQRRFQHLVNEGKDRAAEIADLKPKAEHFDRITGFMQEHNIQPEEFNNAMEITRLINSGDFNKALDVLGPIYQELATKAGKVLPADLQEEVRLGYISEAYAKDLHENRTKAANAEQRQQQTQEQSEAERQQREVQEQINTAVSVADDWAKAKATSDPDWSQKQDEVAEQVELEISRLGPEGFPKTREAVIKLSEDALKKVEERLKRLAPKPQKVDPPATDGSVSPHSQAKPGTYMEAIDQALAK